MVESYLYQSVCQDCGATGQRITDTNPNPNLGPAYVPGKCPCPINGKPNEAPHRAKWEKTRIR